MYKYIHIFLICVILVIFVILRNFVICVFFVNFVSFLICVIFVNFVTLVYFVNFVNVGLPGPLWPPVELKVELPTKTVQPYAATLTLHTLNLLKRPHTSKCVFDFYNIFKTGKSGGLNSVGLWAAVLDLLRRCVRVRSVVGFPCFLVASLRPNAFCCIFVPGRCVVASEFSFSVVFHCCVCVCVSLRLCIYFLEA